LLDRLKSAPIAALRHNGTKTSIITAAGTASVASASTLSVIEYGSNSIFEVAARYVELGHTKLESSVSHCRTEFDDHWRLLSRQV
jgi:hypothetical protein